MKQTNFETLIISLICFFTIFFIITYGLLFIKPFLGLAYYDDIYYVNMAKNITKPEQSPYRYRILTPLIVYLLPFDYLIGFSIINLFTLYFTSLLFYFYLKKLEFSFKISIVGILLFLLNPITLYLIQFICYVDFLLFFFFLLSFYALLIKNEKLFIISLSLGIINKEVIIIIIILYFILKYKEDNNIKKAIIHTGLISIIPIIIFLIIAIIYGVSDTSYLFNETIWIFTYYWPNNLFYIPYFIYQCFGILWIISLVYIKKIENTFLKKAIYFFPFIFLTSLNATNLARILFLAFPIIIPISLYIFKDLSITFKKIYSILILSIILLSIRIIGVIYYYSFFPSICTADSFFYWLLLTSFFEVFIISIISYLLIRKLLDRIHITKKSKSKEMLID